MAQILADRRDIDFILYEQLKVDELAKHERFSEFNRKVIDLIVSKAWKALREGEWLAMTEDPEWGGQGMPRTVASAAADYFMSANFAFMMYVGLSHGAGKLIETFGSDVQK